MSAPLPRLTPIDWPEPLHADALHGLAGEAVRFISERSEADPAGILFAFLQGFGNFVGRGPGTQISGTYHATNIFLLLVGDTSDGRKGTTWEDTRALLKVAFPDWSRERVVSGITSGEGLLDAVRDPRTRTRKAKDGEEDRADDNGCVTEVIEDGVEDKRLFVVESEFVTVLAAMARSASTVSDRVRSLWDSGDAQQLAKGDNARRATGAHVSIQGHITPDELVARLTKAGMGNGFANRFMHVAVRRSQSLPWGADLSPEAVRPLANRVREAGEFARELGQMDIAGKAARSRWEEEYERLTEGPPGLLGAVTLRAAPIVRRLAVIYAALDQSQVIEAEHLGAALAAWTYCADSAKYIFGDHTGNSLAEKIRLLLRDAGSNGLSRTDIQNKLGRHEKADQIAAALALLAQLGHAERLHAEPTGGRPAEHWRSREPSVVGSGAQDLCSLTSHVAAGSPGFNGSHQ